MPAPDLRALSQRVADELGDVTVSQEGAVSVFGHGGVFARASVDVMEVRLPADIADAALRTPDTTPGGEGGGWVRFAPTSDESHDIDRAEAWFRTAWRHSGTR